MVMEMEMVMEMVMETVMEVVMIYVMIEPLGFLFLISLRIVHNLWFACMNLPVQPHNRNFKSRRIPMLRNR